MTVRELNKVSELLKFVLNNKFSRFYKDKYAKLKISLKFPKDFERIPFLTREEIVDSPPMTRIFIPEKEILVWVTSSGTVSRGKPLIMPMNKVRQAYINRLYTKINKLGVRKILLLASPSYVNGRLLDWSAHPSLSKFPIIYCDINNLGLAARLAVELKVEGIETTPSALNFLIPYLLETYDLSKIKFISLGGEFTSSQKFKFFRSYFKNAHFEFRFGGAETRFFKAFRCDFLAQNSPPRVFHPYPRYFLFEVISEDGKPIKEGENGELVLTSLTTKAPFPLIRYKTGDLVTLYKTTCPCGKREFMEILGRVGYDQARIGGITVHTNMIEEAMARSVSNFNGDYELHLFEEIHENRLMPRLILKLSSMRKGSRELESLRKKIEENLRVSSRLYLSDLVKQEIFLPLRLEIVDRFPKTYKRIKIISHMA